MNGSFDTWRTPPAKFRANFEHVDLWRVNLKLPEAGRRQSLRDTLSEDENARADRFHFQAHRDNFLVGHAALREILSNYLSLAAKDITFRNNKYGKPEIDKRLNPNNLQFNLSHSADWALIAVTIGRRVGVDVEHIRPDVECLSLAQSYFSRSEYQSLLLLDEQACRRAFFACWTRKEAFIKAIGEGLSFPLADFSVNTSPDDLPAMEIIENSAYSISDWTFATCSPSKEYFGTVVYEKTPCSVNCWNWDFEKNR
jgi:4'-phosphopantetheinyl transferase